MVLTSDQLSRMMGKLSCSDFKMASIPTNQRSRDNIPTFHPIEFLRKPFENTTVMRNPGKVVSFFFAVLDVGSTNQSKSSSLVIGGKNNKSEENQTVIVFPSSELDQGNQQHKVK